MTSNANVIHPSLIREEILQWQVPSSRRRKKHYKMRKKMRLNRFAHAFGFRVNNRQFLLSLKRLQRQKIITVIEQDRQKTVLIHDPAEVAVYFYGKGKKKTPKKTPRVIKKKKKQSRYLLYTVCLYNKDCSGKKYVYSEDRSICLFKKITCNQQERWYRLR